MIPPVQKNEFRYQYVHRIMRMGHSAVQASEFWSELQRQDREKRMENRNVNDGKERGNDQHSQSTNLFGSTEKGCSTNLMQNNGLMTNEHTDNNERRASGAHGINSLPDVNGDETGQPIVNYGIEFLEETRARSQNSFVHSNNSSMSINTPLDRAINEHNARSGSEKVTIFKMASKQREVGQNSSKQVHDFAKQRTGIPDTLLFTNKNSHQYRDQQTQSTPEGYMTQSNANFHYNANVQLERGHNAGQYMEHLKQIQSQAYEILLGETNLKKINDEVLNLRLPFHNIPYHNRKEYLTVNTQLFEAGTVLLNRIKALRTDLVFDSADYVAEIRGLFTPQPRNDYANPPPRVTNDFRNQGQPRVVKYAVREATLPKNRTVEPTHTGAKGQYDNFTGYHSGREPYIENTRTHNAAKGPYDNVTGYHSGRDPYVENMTTRNNVGYNYGDSFDPSNYEHQSYHRMAPIDYHSQAYNQPRAFPYMEPPPERFGWGDPSAMEQQRNSYRCHEAHAQGYPLPYGHFPSMNFANGRNNTVIGAMKCVAPPAYDPDKKSAYVYLMELEDSLTSGRIDPSQWLFNVRPLLKPDSLKHWFNDKQYIINSWEHFKQLFRCQYDSSYYENKRQNELLARKFKPDKETIREFIWEIKHLSHDVFPHDTYEKRIARLIDKLPIQVQSRIDKLKLYSYDQLVQLAESVNNDVTLEEERLLSLMDNRISNILTSDRPEIKSFRKAPFKQQQQLPAPRYAKNAVGNANGEDKQGKINTEPKQLGFDKNQREEMLEKIKQFRCYGCGSVGHKANNCPKKKPQEAPKLHVIEFLADEDECNICLSKEHKSSECGEDPLDVETINSLMAMNVNFNEDTEQESENFDGEA